MTRGAITGNKFARITALIILAVVILAIIFLFALTLPPGENLVRNLASASLENVLGRRVAIEALETNIFSRLNVSGIKIFSVAKGDTVTLVELSSVHLRYNAVELLRRRLVIDSLRIDGVTLFVERDSTGILNIPGAEGGGRSEQGRERQILEIVPLNVSVDDLDIYYSDERSGIGISLISTGLTLENIQPGNYLWDLNVPRGMVSFMSDSVRVGPVRLQGSTGADSTRIDSLSVKLPGIFLVGSGALITCTERPLIKGIVEIQGNLDTLGCYLKAGIPEALSPLEGGIGGRLAFRGAVGEPDFKTEIQIADLRAGRVEASSIGLKALYSKDTLTVEGFDVNLYGGYIGGRAKIPFLRKDRSELNISLNAIDLSRILQAIHGSKISYQGRVSGSVYAVGDLMEYRRLELTAMLNLEKAWLDFRQIDDTCIELRYSSGNMSFQMNQGSSEVRMGGNLKGDLLTADFSAEIQDIEPIAALLRVTGATGEISVRGTVAGSPKAPVFRTDIKSSGIRYQGISVDSISGHVNVRGKEPEFRDLIFVGEFDGESVPADRLGISALTGTYIFKGSLDGTMEDPAGDLEISMNKPGYSGALFDKGFLRAELSGGRVRLDTLSVEKDSILVLGRGELDIRGLVGEGEMFLYWKNREDGKAKQMNESDEKHSPFRYCMGAVRARFETPDPGYYHFEVDVDGVDINLAASLAGAGSLPLCGKLNMFLRCNGNIEDPNVKGNFCLRSPELRKAVFDSICGSLDLADHTFLMKELRIYHSGGVAECGASLGFVRKTEGGYGISQHSPFSGEIKIEKFNISNLDGLVSPGVILGGVCSVGLVWDGELIEPDADGFIRLNGGRVKVNGRYPEIVDLNLHLLLSNDVITISNLSGYMGRVPFDVAGELKYSGLHYLDINTSVSMAGYGRGAVVGKIRRDSIQVDAEIRETDISPFVSFLPGMEKLAGVLNTRVRVSGEIKDPVLEGKLTGRSMYIKPRVLDKPLERGRVNVTFSKNTVNVDTLSFRSDRGILSVRGGIGYHHAQPDSFDLYVRASNFTVKRSGLGALEFDSAALTWKTTNSYHHLAGEVNLGRAEYSTDFRPHSVLPFVRSLEKPKKEMHPILQNTSLDLRVREREGIWINNNLARVKLNTALSVKGYASKPNLEGRISTGEGYILFLDRKFTIDRGVFDFIDPARINPLIDLEATTTVKSYSAMTPTTHQIKLVVEGPLDQVRVSLRSVPSLERPDIIALLTLGVTRESMSETGDSENTSLSEVIMERARALSSRRVSSYVSRNMANLLGLDEVTIEGNLFRLGESQGAELTASKRFYKRANVIFRTDIGHLNEHSIILDYRLTEKLSIQGETDQFGRSGLDFKYSRRFR